MNKYQKMGCINCNERVCKECWPKYDNPNSKQGKEMYNVVIYHVYIYIFLTNIII